MKNIKIYYVTKDVKEFGFRKGDFVYAGTKYLHLISTPRQSAINILDYRLIKRRFPQSYTEHDMSKKYLVYMALSKFADPDFYTITQQTSVKRYDWLTIPTPEQLKNIAPHLPVRNFK